MKPEQDDQASRTPDWRTVSVYLDETAKYHNSRNVAVTDPFVRQYNEMCAQIFAVLSGAIKEGLR